MRNKTFPLQVVTDEEAGNEGFDLLKEPFSNVYRTAFYKTYYVLPFSGQTVQGRGNEDFVHNLSGKFHLRKGISTENLRDILKTYD